jgi:hypothetical protein
VKGGRKVVLAIFLFWAFFLSALGILLNRYDWL